VSLHLYLADDGHNAAAALEAMLAKAAERGRRAWWPEPLHIWLSGGLARPFVFGPVVGLNGWREAQEAAQALASAASGIAAPCTARVETDPTSTRALATAVSTALIDGVYDATRTRKLRLASVRPWWARVTEDARLAQNNDLLLCCRDEAVLTALAWRGQEVVFAATYPTSSGTHDDATLIRRLQSSLGIADDNVAIARSVEREGAGTQAYKLEMFLSEAQA
jgi:hypothetical protein